MISLQIGKILESRYDITVNKDASSVAPALEKEAQDRSLKQAKSWSPPRPSSEPSRLVHSHNQSGLEETFTWQINPENNNARLLLTVNATPGCVTKLRLAAVLASISLGLFAALVAGLGDMQGPAADWLGVCAILIGFTCFAITVRYWSPGLSLGKACFSVLEATCRGKNWRAHLQQSDTAGGIGRYIIKKLAFAFLLAAVVDLVVVIVLKVIGEPETGLVMPVVWGLAGYGVGLLDRPGIPGEGLHKRMFALGGLWHWQLVVALAPIGCLFLFVDGYWWPTSGLDLKSAKGMIAADVSMSVLILLACVGMWTHHRTRLNVLEEKGDSVWVHDSVVPRGAVVVLLKQL